LRVADSYIGNHLEDDFTPPETIRRPYSVIPFVLEGKTFEPERGGGEGFVEKSRGGYEQDIDEQDEKKKRSGEDDEEIRICCGLNNE
ncbi:hypothetical protein Tco_1497719, partial [Tanacetum coccineum]